MSRWLEREMAAAVAAMTIDLECELIDCGVHPWVFSRCPPGGYRYGLIGYGKISLEPGGSRLPCYFPDPLGLPAFLTPLRRQRHSTIEATLPEFIWNGELLDIIAWSPADIDRWAWRVGDPDALWLGLAPPLPYPTPIHSTPLAWLGAACRGICPLTDDVSTILGLSAVIPESHAHAASLTRRCGIEYGDPRLLTPGLRYR